MPSAALGKRLKVDPPGLSPGPKRSIALAVVVKAKPATPKPSREARAIKPVIPGTSSIVSSHLTKAPVVSIGPPSGAGFSFI
ncbi:unannotated protein [freshwater metagenome]|uniref:Unannotated protein n=1 Tax=freshwater metagenome TaxID=449393 RepID=A0A6J7Q0V9_9ZZZZ